MKKKWLKTLCAMIAVCLVPQFLLGCQSGLPDSAVIDENYEWLDKSVTDSARLASWEEEIKLDLVAWNTNQMGGFKRYTSSNDIVSAEIKRVTGVSINTDKLIDNAGKTAAVRFGDLLTTGLPDIAFGSAWIDTDEVYDLTEYIDKYCPTIKARMPESVWTVRTINGGQRGKVYAVPFGLGNVSLTEVDQGADKTKSMMFEYNHDYYPYVLVREDILKDAYPSAKTQGEIQALFDSQGYFTEADLFDVPITSAEAFRTSFLPKIYGAIRNTKKPDGTYKYRINAERWVEPMLIGDGNDRDTWSFLGILLPFLMGATATYTNTMFTYWDAIDQVCKVMAAQDFYKAELKKWVEIIAEGRYASQYGLINANSLIQSELNRGYYAIAYPPNCMPAGNIATLGDDTVVNYRKVYMKIPQNERFEYFVNAVPGPSGVSIFKDSVRESDIPQILRWLDFQASELGDKLFAWGPETAGLFEEKEVDGKTVRQYKSEELVNQMVYSTASLGKDVQNYNLSNGAIESAQPVFPFFYCGGSKDHPKCIYDLSKLSSLVNVYFSSAAVNSDKQKVKLARSPGIDGW
ncbi:MAG: hypothetical protein LBH24_01155 [Clostridiales bacterium]|jgi:hypothetical protein|nr:hypothetical protein [Clostridiales bacterium]